MNIYVQPLAFMEGLGGGEVFLVVVGVFVLFGGDKLPEFARGAGKLIREFKKASSGVEEEFKRALEEEDRKKTVPTPVIPTVPLSPPLPSIEDTSAAFPSESDTFPSAESTPPSA